MKYKRVLLKLSGEQLGGAKEYGIDADFMKNLADDIKRIIGETKVEMAIVLGGGNIARGTEVAARGVDEITGHYMGMLGGLINGMAFTEMLSGAGQPSSLMSKLQIEGATGAEPFNRLVAKRYLEEGRVVVLGSSGKPFFTHDSAAVLAALELECEVVLKATKVDGVYDKDPIKHAGARKYDKLSHGEALQNPNINVMDKTALSLAMERSLPIIVFKLSAENLKKVIQGKAIGSRVSA
ncbi:MAG TPA: uridine monophosphate kinase [Candidatus Saccharimonadales bacterium]|nr:uridine monophosphate kinase [Candidatus Saccharimonadales bacterium]